MTTTATRLGPKTLRKRNGDIVPFDLQKIQRAITAAGDGASEFGPAMAWMVAHAVGVRLADSTALDTALVQALVEQQLMDAGYFDSARAFIVRHERRRSNYAAADNDCARHA